MTTEELLERIAVALEFQATDRGHMNDRYLGAIDRQAKLQREQHERWLGIVSKIEDSIGTIGQVDKVIADLAARLDELADRVWALEPIAPEQARQAEEAK